MVGANPLHHLPSWTPEAEELYHQTKTKLWSVWIVYNITIKLRARPQVEIKSEILKDAKAGKAFLG